MIHIDALDIATVVLEEVRQLVVEQNCVVELVGYVELDETLPFLIESGVGVVGAIEESELRFRIGSVRVTRAETIIVIGKVNEVELSRRRRSCLVLACSVIQCNLGNL